MFVWFHDCTFVGKFTVTGESVLLAQPQWNFTVVCVVALGIDCQFIHVKVGMKGPLSSLYCKSATFVCNIELVSGIKIHGNDFIQKGFRSGDWPQYYVENMSWNKPPCSLEYCNVNTWVSIFNGLFLNMKTVKETNRILEIPKKSAEELKKSWAKFKMSICNYNPAQYLLPGRELGIKGIFFFFESRGLGLAP